MTAEQIKKVIRRCGMTQREVAQIIGITPQTLYERIERKNISTSTLESIAKALQISPAEFYEEEIETKIREENERLRKLVAEQMETIKVLLMKEKEGK